MTRRVEVHPSALETIRAMRGAERSLVLAQVRGVEEYADRLDVLDRHLLRRDLWMLRRVAVRGELRVVYGVTDDVIYVLMVGDRRAGQTPDFFGLLRERIDAGDFAEELEAITRFETERAKPTEQAEEEAEREDGSV